MHRHITVGNSKGNGMVERTIRSVKDTIRKFQAQFTDSYWSDSIPYALIALNHTPQASHGIPPFTIIHGSPPVYMSDLANILVPFPKPSTDEEEERYSLELLN